MARLPETFPGLEMAGGDPAALADRETAHLVLLGHDLLSLREVPGILIATEEASDGIVARVTVSAGAYVEKPIHLCAGLLGRSGTQTIRPRVIVEPGAIVRVIAHCFFPLGERVRHVMEALVEIGEEAEMHYSEGHYHGPLGGVEVLPKAVVRLGPGGRYFSSFSLVRGRVGKLGIDYLVEVGDRALAELTARVSGHGRDEIRIKERIVLAGRGSRGLIKARVAVEDDASSEVTGITEGNAEGARGHMDCLEVVKDRAVASAIPLVKVTHPLAKVTHEAAIGSVDKKQMETLMAHGLTPEQAVEMIVSGMLR